MTMDWYDRSGTWSVSQWNRHGLELPALAPQLSDCTLRDGEQQVGIVFTAEEKVALAKLLDAAGVPDLEVGTPAVSEEDRAAVEEICAAGLDAKISALARATESDIDRAVACGVDFVRVSFPISARQRDAKLRTNADEYVEKALKMASYAKSCGVGVIFSPYDTTRCDLELLERLLASFAREGCVDRIRLVDTVGAATPESIRYLTRFMIEASEGIPIEVHCHDDFGMAVANTVAGALSGAAYLSTTIGGFGERSGNAALEEVAMTLEVLYGIDTGVKLEALAPLAHEVARRAGVELQPHKAVVGANSFAHESGTVVAGVLKDPFTAEPYAPELVGQTRRIAVGKKSGAVSIGFKLARAGIDADAEAVNELLGAVKQEARVQKRSLTDDEFLVLADNVMRASHK